jgi:hypothetical protein
MIMNSMAMNTIADETDIDELKVNKNTVGRPLLNNEAGRPIICDPSTKESKGSRPKNKPKVAILQMQQFRDFLRGMRCGATMERCKFICGAALRIEQEKPLDHPGVRMKIKCLRGHLYGMKVKLID